jgi:hypothetical protein
MFWLCGHSSDLCAAHLDAIEQLHKDEMIGSYDAAVIDKENGEPRTVSG